MTNEHTHYCIDIQYLPYVKHAKKKQKNAGQIFPGLLCQAGRSISPSSDGHH